MRKLCRHIEGLGSFLQLDVFERTAYLRSISWKTVGCNTLVREGIYEASR